MIITSVRQASASEMASEIDRRGAAIEKLEAERDGLLDALTTAEAQVGADERRFEQIRTILVNHLDEPERAAFWIAVEGRDAARTALLAGTPPSVAETEEKAS